MYQHQFLQTLASKERTHCQSPKSITHPFEIIFNHISIKENDNSNSNILYLRKKTTFVQQTKNPHHTFFHSLRSLEIWDSRSPNDKSVPLLPLWALALPASKDSKIEENAKLKPDKPWKINMKLKNGGWVQMIFLLNWIILRFHVNFPRCKTQVKRQPVFIHPRSWIYWDILCVQEFCAAKFEFLE